jgi:rubrerythrin
MKNYGILDQNKEFVCRQCGLFLDLKDGKYPNCKTDEDIFVNDLNDEENEN